MNKHYLLLCALFLLLQACNKDDDTGNDAPKLDCMPGNLTTHFIAFYPFSNGSLKDFSGNGMHLTNNTTAKAAPDRNGNANCAFEFDNYPAAADSLTTAIVQKLNGVTVFSVSLWYQPLDTNVQAGPARVEDIVAYDKWKISLFDCRKPNFYYVDKNANIVWSAWDTNMVAFNTPDLCQVEQKKRTDVWHHLAVTFDKANNKVKLYSDGVLREEDVSVTGTWNFSVYPATLAIGGTFTGRLDDIAIFNKVLTAAEVNMAFQSGACCSK